MEGTTKSRGLSHSDQSAKSDRDEFAKFSEFMRRLVAVPHSEVKAQLDAEKQEKKQRKKRTSVRASTAKG